MSLENKDCAYIHSDVVRGIFVSRFIGLCPTLDFALLPLLLLTLYLAQVYGLLLCIWFETTVCVPLETKKAVQRCVSVGSAVLVSI